MKFPSACSSLVTFSELRVLIATLRVSFGMVSSANVSPVRIADIARKVSNGKEMTCSSKLSSVGACLVATDCSWISCFFRLLSWLEVEILE